MIVSGCRKNEEAYAKANSGFPITFFITNYYESHKAGLSKNKALFGLKNINLHHKYLRLAKKILYIYIYIYTL